MTLGTFYGVGVGPGAPDLLTLRALKVLNQVPVLAVPRPSPYASSFAWRIVESVIDPNHPRDILRLTFPMSKDPEVLIPAWEEAVAAIRRELEQGRDVAFITQGDPMVYSTFIYLDEALKREMPQLAIQVIPGVTSLSAVPHAAGIPLADGQERIAVLPATYGTDDLRGILRSFDSVLLMKVSSRITEIIDALEAEGLLEQATYVERATTSDERVIRGRDGLLALRGDRCVYFSMVFVHKKRRSGILSGKTHGEHHRKTQVEAEGSI